ncbi:MAG TPA: hypothetical protein VLB73_03800 [Patescibacteria group bacterium]|nr:hypothetical protein [Patescibacteria group bacterium]
MSKAEDRRRDEGLIPPSDPQKRAKWFRAQNEKRRRNEEARRVERAAKRKPPTGRPNSGWTANSFLPSPDGPAATRHFDDHRQPPKRGGRG